MVLSYETVYRVHRNKGTCTVSYTALTSTITLHIMAYISPIAMHTMFDHSDSENFGNNYCCHMQLCSVLNIESCCKGLSTLEYYTTQINISGQLDTPLLSGKARVSF